MIEICVGSCVGFVIGWLLMRILLWALGRD